MKSPLILSAVAAVLAAAPALAQDNAQAAPTGPEIIRASDTQMTCVQISDEAAQLSAAMGSEPRGSVFGRIGGVAKAGAAMLIPGAGLAMAAADAATSGDRERREAEALAGQHRWYYLNGLYTGQGCQTGQGQTQAAASVTRDTSAVSAPRTSVPPTQ